MLARRIRQVYLMDRNTVLEPLNRFASFRNFAFQHKTIADDDFNVIQFLSEDHRQWPHGNFARCRDAVNGAPSYAKKS